MYKEWEDDISSIPFPGQLEKKASISCSEQFSLGYWKNSAEGGIFS